MKKILFCCITLSVILNSCSTSSENSTEPVPNDKQISSFDTINTVLLSQDELSKLSTKGHYLTNIAACGSCHSANPRPDSPLSGGKNVNDDIGSLNVPNITSDVETGIGSWSIGEIKKAIREGVAKDGRLLSSSAHNAYRWMSDEDALSIAMYITKTSPVKNKVEKRSSSNFQNKKWGLISKHSEVEGYVPNLPEKSGGYRGMYLVNFVQNCARCHSPKENMADKISFLDGYQGELYFTDSENSYEVPSIRAKNITKKENFVVDHLSRNKELKKDLLCPTNFYLNLTDADKKAIEVYLKSLK